MQSKIFTRSYFWTEQVSSITMIIGKQKYMTYSPFFYMHFFPFSRIPAATDTLKKIVKHQNRVYTVVLYLGSPSCQRLQT